MAAPPVKSPLHNFPLPYLKWGSKKDSRCRRTPPHETPLSPPLDPTSTTAAAATAVEHSNPVGSRSSRNRRINLPPALEEDDDVAKKEKHPEDDGGGGGGGDEKGWNLRPRRAVTIKTTSNTNTNTNTVVESGGNGGDGMVKSMRLRGVETLGGGGCGGGGSSGGGGGGGERREKRKFWIALSRDEIEEDIYSMTASKPSRRPKKRPKNVQKQLDNVFPGLWLVGISPEAYRGLDVPPKR